MSTGTYHYPPELMRLLRDTISLLCRSKPDVISFLRGCGVPDVMLGDLQRQVQVDPNAIKKYEITGTVLEQLNTQYRDGNDRALGPLREITRRVVEFENFSACWPDDQLKARGLVAEVRSLVGTKDAFTQMRQERERERAARMAEAAAKAERIQQRQAERRSLHQQLAGLASWTNPQARGKALEGILNCVFALDGMLVRESFAINAEDGGTGEQIDGMVALDGHDYMVEMKWWQPPIEINAVSRHLVRLYGRAEMRGLMISASGYTPPAIEECKRALTNRVIVLSDLHEVMLVLDRDGDLADWLRRKVRAATVDRQPYRVIGPGEMHTDPSRG
jgi:restriction system protein